MSVVVSIEGLDRVKGVWNNARLLQKLDDALVEGSGAIRDMTKKLPPVSAGTTGYDARGIPVDTGRLRQSIHSRKVSLLAAGVFAKTNYAGFVHDGTSRVPARPFFEWTMELGGKDRVEFIMKYHLRQFARGK